jgi:hypothetical protein
MIGIFQNGGATIFICAMPLEFLLRKSAMLTHVRSRHCWRNLIRRLGFAWMKES